MFGSCHLPRKTTSPRYTAALQAAGSYTLQQPMLGGPGVQHDRLSCCQNWSLTTALLESPGAEFSNCSAVQSSYAAQQCQSMSS